jgi:Transposase domain (DUF772)
VPAEYGLTWDNCLWRWDGHRFSRALTIRGCCWVTGCGKGRCIGCWPAMGIRCSPDGYFAGLFTESAKGRPTVAARVVATVMLLQAFEGLSDREACDRLEVDLRWQAAGVDAGYRAFHPTVLVGMRNKLRASARPRRLLRTPRSWPARPGR